MLSDSGILLFAAAGVALLAALVIVALVRMRRGFAAVADSLAGRLEASATHLHARLDGFTSVVNQRLDTVTGHLNDRLRDATDSLDRRLAENTASLNERLTETMRLANQSSRAVGERLESVSRVVGDVHASLGRMGEANRRILEVGQSISSLQEILRAPKLRGGLGELFLSEVLAQILTPEHFTLQHRFRSGETVDAVVRLGDGLVPIDSKFPLESFRRLMGLADESERQREKRQFVRDVKRHVDAIAKKYILPDEGTFGFAFMYIPAENVYYEIILRDEDLGDGGSLLEHALGRHVIPVSPSSFYAYLQSILLGLRGMRIEQRAREITAHLARLQGEFGKFGDCFETLGKHLKNAQNTFDRADGIRKRFEAKLETSAELGGSAAEGGVLESSGRTEAGAPRSAEIPLFPQAPDAEAGDQEPAAGHAARAGGPPTP